jgi:hypothetical protein
MLKSSSLCLYSSNLGTFWLKIEQFWPFEETSIFSNGGHLGFPIGTKITNFKVSTNQNTLWALAAMLDFRSVPKTNFLYMTIQWMTTTGQLSLPLDSIGISLKNLFVRNYSTN